MILKTKDSRQSDIQELNRLLTLKPTAKQQFLIEREMKCLLSGERNEQNSAYYLDFRYKDSQNWAVIHDLRRKCRGSGFQDDKMSQSLTAIPHKLSTRLLPSSQPAPTRWKNPHSHIVE